jgi:peptidoglycan/xylan/chitin deacetylase (PgdA/CDA1 family)
MLGYIHIKRGLKRTAGWTAAGLDRCSRLPAEGQACILMYHRVAPIGFRDARVDDWNISPRRFEEQMRWLSMAANVVPLREIPERLSRPVGGKPLVALSFDDGYANFWTHAAPILVRYGLCATVFVVTSAIGSPRPLPFDAWSRKHHERVPGDTCRSLDWAEIDSCLQTGLVTVGSHSHEHLDAARCTPQQLADEAGVSREMLLCRLGETHANLFAYPYGGRRGRSIAPSYVSAVQAAGYTMAVGTGVQRVTHLSDRFGLPRMESHDVDTLWVLRAKARGAIAPYYLVDRLKSVHRREALYDG